MAEKPRTPPAKSQKANPYPWYSPRFWHGMRFGDWFSLCARHRFRIHPLRWPMAALITPASVFNSCMAGVQSWKHGRQIEQTAIEHPPIFIIGHWRSGTTLLHELMVLDERFAYPTTYECMAPHHYLLTEWFFRRYANFLIPNKRPMDNMAAGWDHPQEDEFALCNLGVPSIYTRIAFPNSPIEGMSVLDMADMPANERQRWCEAMEYFVKSLTYAKQKRIVLKSPPHTGRIEVLSKLFPKAKFIHIARNPRSIFPSTKRLWKSLDEVQALQWPKHRNLDEFVFEAFERMYRGYDAYRDALGKDQLYELRYEDLVRDPAAEIGRIYEALGLGDFEAVRPRVVGHMQGQKDYATNRHELDDATRAQIRRRWAGYIERYGYGDDI